MQLDASLPSTVYRVDREAMRLFDTPGGLRYACETLTGIDAYKVTGSRTPHLGHELMHYD